MYEKSVGIVLQLTPFSDSQKVVRVFTRDFGTRSFMVSLHGKSRGARAAAALFRPMQELNFVFKNVSPDQLGRVKEVSPAQLFSNLHQHHAKRLIALFLAEVLYRVLKNHQEDQALYDYVLSGLHSLEKTEEKIADFHLFFMAGLASALGFHPENNFDSNNRFFNPQEGMFVHQTYAASGTIRDEVLSEKINLIFNPIDSSEDVLQITREQRAAILNILIDYFRYHVPEFTEIKSIEVLKEIV
jgi:DNA repair protein RecO (recombination protein O)